jgi:hypothetical protein
MFDLFLYAFTILFVLTLAGECRKPVRSQKDLWAEVEELSVGSIGCRIEYDTFDTGAVNQAIKQGLSAVKRSELMCATAAEIRALCKVHSISVPVRGRISRNVIEQLMEVV